jgi:oxygen-independent coproporphyrinogen III oxidase
LQYEISNFARVDHESRHNLKYWMRQPYLGFGVDAHSMLQVSGEDNSAVRFFASDSLEEYVAGSPLKRTPVDKQAALEEAFFLGLRLTRGVDLEKVSGEFGPSAVAALQPAIVELIQAGLIEPRGNAICLTARGRLLSNEVFERFISTAV